ncbi:MAG: hypothetical protein AAFQ91_28010 [Cyanobacteria bacterium J06621_15]
MSIDKGKPENSPDTKNNQDLLKDISANDIKTGNISQKNETTNNFINIFISGNESISSETKAIISALSPILAQINPKTIQQAYQKSLPPDAELWDLESNNITAILTKLDEFRKLPDFVGQLTQDADISEEIREKIKHYAKKLPPKKPQENKIDKPPNNCPHILESFVLFTLNSTENKDRFLLNAWLIQDNSLEDISKFQSLLSSNEQQ